MSDLEIVKDLLNNKTFIEKENELSDLLNVKKKFLDIHLTFNDPRWKEATDNELAIINRYNLKNLKFDIKSRSVVACDDEICSSMYGNPLVDFNYPGGNMFYRLKNNENEEYNLNTHPFFKRITQLENELMNDRVKLMSALESLSISTTYNQCINNIDIKNIANSTINLDNIQQAVTCMTTNNSKENFIFREKMSKLGLEDIIAINDKTAKKKKETLEIVPFPVSNFNRQRDPNGILPESRNQKTVKEKLQLYGTMTPGPIVMIDPKLEGFTTGYFNRLALDDSQRTPTLIRDISSRNKEYYPDHFTMKKVGTNWSGGNANTGITRYGKVNTGKGDRFTVKKNAATASKKKERLANYGALSSLEQAPVFEKILFQDQSPYIKKLEQEKKKDKFTMPLFLRYKYTLAEFIESRNFVAGFIQDAYKRLRDCISYYIYGINYIIEQARDDTAKLNQLFYNDQNLIKIKSVFDKIKNGLNKHFIVFDDNEEIMYFNDIYGGNYSAFSYKDLYEESSGRETLIVLDGQMQIFTASTISNLTGLTTKQEIETIERFYKDKGLFFFIVTTNPTSYVNLLNPEWSMLKTQNGRHSIAYKKMDTIFQITNGNVNDNIMLLTPPKELFTITLE